MALGDVTERGAVLAAMQEFDRLGRDDFLHRYGFGPSREYEVLHNGQRYDSKAVLGAAHGHQHGDAGPLRSDDFSGGAPTIRKLEELGFNVVPVEGRGRGDRTGSRLAQFLEVYASARAAQFSGDHEASAVLRSAAASLGERLSGLLPEARVRPSVGQGNWAKVPWIAVLEPRETDSTQHGTYPVILIPEDLSGIYLTLAQGVTDLRRELGQRAAFEELHRRADVLRPSLTSLLEHGFELDNRVELGDSPLGRGYAESVIASKHVPASVVRDHSVEDDMAELTASYAELLERGQLRFDEEVQTGEQVLCIYVGEAASANFETGGRQGWWGWRSAPSDLELLRPGDLVLFGRGYTGGSPRVDSETWQTGALRDAVIGRVEELPARTG